MEAAEAPIASQNFFNPLMLATFGITATALLLVSYHLIVSKFCRRRSNPTTQHYHTRDTSRGVDEKVLNLIPIQPYKNMEKEASLGIDQCECAVCLGEFEEGEPVRLLPSCQHLFHLQCIDEWFISHSNCPLCRSPIVVVNVNGVDEDHVLHESQDQGSLLVCIDTDGSRKYSKTNLSHCSSVLLSVERKPQLSLARLKRSVSDCSYVSIKIHLDHENAPSSSSSSSSCSKKVEYQRCSSARRGSFRLMEPSVTRMRSFSPLG